MDRLRPRQREVHIGFTKAEVEKMEKLLMEFGKQVLEREFCQSIAKSFNRSAGRAGKPVVKWAEIQSWFQSREQDLPNIPRSISKKESVCPSSKGLQSSEIPEEEKSSDLSGLEFEARSSKDGAWYDIDKFLAHRVLSTGETEVRVRFTGFGADEDEWVNVKKSVRERSIPVDPDECHKLKVGDLVLCFQEKRDQAIYYDAHIIEIQKRMHDIRGCRCLFSIRYNHDNTEERVRLRRLCWTHRP